MKKSFLFLFLFVSANIFAQSSLVPIDTAIRKGVLSNGLTYYIRHNEKPKERAEFHIAQNVGAILELDHQNGLAHFLEHIAFNGSEHFPDKGIINYFESIGVNFGGNINAYTSLDETVYRLSDVPTYREGIIDSALFVLYDWACALTLADEEIDAERGVILEEWRTRANANRRMWKASQAQKYAGSQYAKRDVIGDTAVIKHFEYQALKDYYKKWYGPDLQAIVIVGDIDVDKIERKIIDIFGKIPPRKNRGERPIYYLPENTEPIVSIVTDKEAQNARISLEYKQLAQPDSVRLSYNGYVKMLADNLISTILSYRFDELTQNPKCSYTGAYAAYTNLTKGNDGFYAIVVPKEGRETEALHDLLSELERADRFGFTNSELERAKTDILNGYEKSFNERNNRQNISLTHEYIRNYLEAECIPGIEWEFEAAKQILPIFSQEYLNELVKSYITPQNLIISFQAPEKEEVKLPTKEETLNVLAVVKNRHLDAPIEETIAKNLIEKSPKAGKIKQTAKNDKLGTTEWFLSNGVKVVIKPTEFKKDEILLDAHSWGGMNTIDNIEDLPSAAFAPIIVANNGFGKYSYIDIQKILAGKTVSLRASIMSNMEMLMGNSSVKDFETMLQSIYLYFNEIRQDDEAYKALIEQYKNYVINRENNPKAIFGDSLSMMETCHDKRNIIYDIETLQKVNQQKALKIFKQRFSAANDFTFIFTGNINPDDKNTQKLICTWLGGMKKGATEKLFLRDECSPKGFTQNHFTRKMEVENGTNVIQYITDMPYSLANELNMEVIGKVLDIRYLESVREKEGGSYGVGVRSSVNVFPPQRAKLHIRFDCNPDKQPALLNIIHAEIKNILENGVRADDLQKAKESLLKDYAENIEKNSWWDSALYYYYWCNKDLVNDYRAAVEAVTAETTLETLKKLIAGGNVLEVVMMPE
ncbi:MAG: insulinase family protein [Prevotellaceae bacterium]|jgi:zinc protease|nr:insulinase family protein [Prevotellaceae bacterium]